MSFTRKRLWQVVKLVFAAAILIGVGDQFRRILSKPEIAGQLAVPRPLYLVPAGLLYLLAHICWATFWVRLLRSQGVAVSWYAGIRAYFVSQFGKYVPGKVAVIVIRLGMLGSSPRMKMAVGVTALYETLTSMGAGALLGVLFLPWLGVLPELVSESVALIVGIAALPLLLAVVNKVAANLAAKRRGPDAPLLPSPPMLLMAQGLLHGVGGWLLLAASLGLTIRAVVANDALPEQAGEFLGNLAAVALSYVVGFVVLVAPGGLGAREYVLQAALAHRFTTEVGTTGEGLAVVVALALRLTWTVAEVALAALLYARRPAERTTGVADAERG